MAIFTIGDLAKLSGIKAHTIRIWEQRYDLLQPKRTPSKNRFYEDEDLQLLLNVALLNRHGYKISKIAAMTQDQVKATVEELSRFSMGLDTHLNLLKLAFVELDEYKFNGVFDHYAEEIGVEGAVLEVIYPFLEKLGLMWLTGSVKPVQENFFTQLVRNKLVANLEALPLPKNRDVPSFLLYLPKGEQHELSMLLVQYLIKKRRFLPINMGEDTGLMDLEDAVRIHRPDFIFTILSETFTQVPLHQYLQNLSAVAGESRLLLTGYQVQDHPEDLPASAMVFDSLAAMQDFLNQLSSSPIKS